MKYTVKKGDTMYGIAKTHGLTLQQLLNLNPHIKDPDKIYVGDQIIVNQTTDTKKVTYVTQFYISRGWKITSKYGIRRDPFSGLNVFHRGIDFGGKKIKDPVQSPISGKVSHSAYYNGWGNLVGVTDENGFIHIFAHLDKCAKKIGQIVTIGEVIGLNGSTGNSTGPHLHYQINTPKGGIVGINAHTDPELFSF